MSTGHFAQIKISRLTKAWLEASLTWPFWCNIQSEDECLVQNFFITWRYIQPFASQITDHAVWVHIHRNLDGIIKEWLFLDQNFLTNSEVRYFSVHLIQVVLDLIWKSNLNLTTLRRFRPVLEKCAKDFELAFPGGFKKLIHVQQISKV